jgi:hypothetical protein
MGGVLTKSAILTVLGRVQRVEAVVDAVVMPTPQSCSIRLGDIPSTMIKTVPHMYEEWTKGINGAPALRDLERDPRQGTRHSLPCVVHIIVHHCTCSLSM